MAPKLIYPKSEIRNSETEIWNYSEIPKLKSEIIPKFWLAEIIKILLEDISPFINPRKTIYSSLDSSRLGESNGNKIIFLWSLVAEIFIAKVFIYIK